MYQNQLEIFNFSAAQFFSAYKDVEENLLEVKKKFGEIGKDSEKGVAIKASAKFFCFGLEHLGIPTSNAFEILLALKTICLSIWKMIF